MASIIFILPCYLFAIDIEAYTKKLSCNSAVNNLCKCVINLKQALVALEKIQNHNFSLIIKSKDKKNQITSHAKEPKDLKKDDISTITYDEYKLLRQYMKNFCKSFANLNIEERQILFTLQWNENPIFQNNEDVIKFCKSKH